MFSPTFVDIGTFIGTIGFFFVLFLLYARTFPVIAQAEVKTILKSSGEKYKKLRDAGKPLYHINIATNLKGDLTVGQPATLDADSNKEKVSSLLGSIGTFDHGSGTPDDLKEVKGIGPQMEKVLNDIGIFSFLQVSKMTQREYDLLDSITGSFPGRAQRDDWAGQAMILNNKK